MNEKRKEILSVVILSIVSFLINFFYASKGVLPIDTFAFFDTGFRILEGDIPFKDYWTISGPIIDLIQSLIFFLFGVNWNAYVLNGSLINVLITLACFYFFNDIGLSKNYSLFYSICVAFLANPSMGTPFPDHYSAFFSLLAVFSFIYGIKYEKKIFWFLIPLLLFLAFFCKQTPAAYIIIFFFLNFVLYFLIKKKYKFILPIGISSIVSLLFLGCFIWIKDINFNSFIAQYFLYPRTIGVERVSDWSFTLNKTVTTLKLIYVILIPLVIIFLKNLFFIKNYIYKDNFFINLNIIFYSILLVIHQWLTLNFIFIFFTIPILCATVQSNLKDNSFYKKICLLIVIFCLLVSIKYHFRFNHERKMLDLEKINLSNFYKAEKISPKLKGLKWITREYSLNSQDEIEKIMKIKKVLQNEDKKIMFLSSYQFFSSILNKQLHSPNRWYGGSVAHPQKDNLYYYQYLLFNYNLIIKNKIEVIYIDTNLGDYQIELYDEILKKFSPGCSNFNEIDEILYKYDISSCYN